MSATANEASGSWAEAYALLAQVMLEAPRRNDPALYESALWETFPLAGISESVNTAVAAVAAACPTSEESLVAVGADYTHLFVGPPKPAAMPWQTAHANPNATSLSGTPTAQVRKALRGLGLQRDEENGQLEDHIGNILMVVAVMAERGLDEERRAFVDDHVLSWLDSLEAAVDEHEETGFYSALLAAVRAVSQADCAAVSTLEDAVEIYKLAP
ncbi:MAG: molecular chaperone TorD family protein [Adlercreutzia sp.]|nr:molecular chaperone TorD family protein [Adlercreutzia sp.]